MHISVNTEGILTSGYQSNIGPIIFKSNADSIISPLKFDSIRFPGGNLGNLYHPFKKGTTEIAPGYGFRTEEFPKNTVFYNIYAEWDKTQTENMIYPFMRWLKSIGVNKILYVANIKNGNIDEILWVINEFTRPDNGIGVFEIEGIELGNELYFAQWGTWTKNILGQWKSTLMTPERYLSLAKPISDAIRSEYPQIPQAVPGWHNGGYTDTNKSISIPQSNNWNLKVSKANFQYEAYVVHDYIRIETTDPSSNLSNLISNVSSLTNYKSSGYITRINEYFSRYFGGKKRWWTELNVEDPARMIGNTVLHGAIMMEAACELKYQGIDIFCFHNLANTIIGMSMIWSAKNSNRVNITSFYHTNLILSKLKGYTENISTSSDGQFHIWRFKKGNDNAICYVNKTTSVKRIDIPSQSSSVYSVSGGLGSSNRSDTDSIVDPAFRLNSNKTGSNWPLSEFSIVDSQISVDYYDAPTGYGIIKWTAIEDFGGIPQSNLQTPTNFRVTVNSPTAADAEWSPVTSASSYEVRQKRTHSLVWAIKKTSETQENLNGLSGNQYQAQVRSNYTGNSSLWSSSIKYTYL